MHMPKVAIRTARRVPKPTAASNGEVRKRTISWSAHDGWYETTGR